MTKNLNLNRDNAFCCVVHSSNLIVFNDHEGDKLYAIMDIASNGFLKSLILHLFKFFHNSIPDIKDMHNATTTDKSISISLIHITFTVCFHFQIVNSVNSGTI